MPITAKNAGNIASDLHVQSDDLYMQSGERFRSQAETPGDTRCQQLPLGVSCRYLMSFYACAIAGANFRERSQKFAQAGKSARLCARNARISWRTGGGLATLRVLNGRDSAGLDCGTCAADTGYSRLPSSYDGAAGARKMATAPRYERDAVNPVRTSPSRERPYMPVSVREHAPACQARCPNAGFRLNALPQASDISHALSSQDVTLIVVGGLVLVTAVVLTAIWADSDRRKAAFDVLDRLWPKGKLPTASRGGGWAPA